MNWTMNDAAAAKKSAARHATTRIAAIRADIRSVEASSPRGKSVMLRALARDLFEQESRLAEVL